MEGKYYCLRNCYVGERLWKKDKIYDLSDTMDRDPKNFRPLEVSAELHEASAEEELNTSYELMKKLENKPKKMRAGYYWCMECQRCHYGQPDKNGKITKIAKKHLKYQG